MSANTTIEWATKTWNPVRGCALVSEGCRNCYAMRQAHRFSGPGKRVVTSRNYLRKAAIGGAD